jgi:hypothetical protein
VGRRFLNFVCDLQLQGEGPLAPLRSRPCSTARTRGLCAALRRDPKWRQISANLYGVDHGRGSRIKGPIQGHYGGHFPTVQGFRYGGDAYAAAEKATT